MITAYVRTDGRLVAVPVERGAPLPDGAVWLDVLRPDEAEREEISTLLGIELPTPEDMREIEASSRLYTEDDAAFLTTPIISRGEDGRPDLGELTFVLTPRVLVTLRHTEPLWLAIFAARALRHPTLVTCHSDALLGLLDAVVDRAADVLEMVGGELDHLSQQVFSEVEPAKPAKAAASESRKRQAARRRMAQRRVRRSGSDGLRDVISAIGRAGDLTHKVRNCLAGLERLTAFTTAVAGPRLSKEQKVRLKTIGRDVHSLVEQTGFLSHQANFLLDATLGVINIQQTSIIKIFSVAAVAFLPPTLVASIYGMNFHFMPELDESWGYPFALLLMVLSGVLPLLYFKRKRWL